MDSKTEAVIEKMTKIALKKIKHYFTDFTKFDIPELVEAGGTNYIWLVRDTGTWLINVSMNYPNLHLFETMIRYSDDAYWVNLENGTVEQMLLDFDFLKSRIN